VAPFGIAVTKSVTWRGAMEEFANVWHYDYVGGALANHEAVADRIVSKEKDIFGSNITFRSVRVWGPTNGNAAENITHLIKDISGVGLVTGGGTIPFELAVVGSWYLGRNPATGRKRFLRKYLHVGRVSGISSGGGPAMGNDALGAPVTDVFKAWFNSLKTLEGLALPSAPDICAPNGDHLPVATDAAVLPHLHVRQFKQ
jgi:hypothetical protein